MRPVISHSKVFNSNNICVHRVEISIYKVVCDVVIGCFFINRIKGALTFYSICNTHFDSNFIVNVVDRRKTDFHNII